MSDAQVLLFLVGFTAILGGGAAIAIYCVRKFTSVTCPYCNHTIPRDVITKQVPCLDCGAELNNQETVDLMPERIQIVNVAEALPIASSCRTTARIAATVLWLTHLY